MSQKQRDLHGKWADLAYALLLWLYPRGYRRAFGEQMQQTFRDHYRDVVGAHRQSALQFWLETLYDTGRSIAGEYMLALVEVLSERANSMKTSVLIVLAVVGGLLLLLGLRVWLSPAMLSAPHGGSTALSSVIGMTILLVVYALVALGLLRARLWTRRPEYAVALRRAALLGAALGVGALAPIAVDTVGDAASPVRLVVWAIVVLAAPICWGVVGLLASRAGGSWRLGLVAALWSGMISALVGTVGEVVTTLIALPRLAQLELSNPDYLYWHQPDAQSYAIASALAVGVIGLILAPVVASIAGSIGSRLGKMEHSFSLPDPAILD